MDLSDAGRSLAREVAQRHQVSPEAVAELLRALAAGRGTQAQFSHPDLGGMGQWSRGGMIMVGDMFNSGLKAKVDALCNELSSVVLEGGVFAAPEAEGRSARGASLFGPAATWWPGDLGVPSSTGAQNDLRYGFFPATRRLAVDVGGAVTVYDTGDHMISGVSQQQGGGQTLAFTSQHGPVRLADLPVVSGGPARAAASGAADPAGPVAEPAAVAAAEAEKPAGPAGAGDADVFTTLERLADLHARGILTQDEFEAKKAELLARI